MHDRRRYKVTDYRFGLLALTLREKAGLTQTEVAEAVGISERAIQHWEAGTAFPAAANLQKLIALYLRHGALTPGHEREEAEAFWKQADESAVRRKSLFDENWFARLVEQMGESAVAAAGHVEAPAAQAHVDWGEAPDATVVYGRERELGTLREWALEGRCRVVAILGMGGMGKTTLATRFADEAMTAFELVLWRSLRHSPPLDELLNDCLGLLFDGPNIPPAPSEERALRMLIDRLRERRCLLVLDDVDSLLEAGSLAGQYREGYESYRQLFRRVAESSHQSCLLLTSREMLSELEPLEGTRAPVRALKLPGLAPAASQELLADKDLFGAPDDWEELVRYFAGNPLALKIAAANIRDLFGGDLCAAISVYRDAVVVEEHPLQQVLNDQFGRLAPLERDVMYWLAIEREYVGIEELNADLSGAMPKQDVLAALRSLRRRSLVERAEHGALFTLQPEVMDYVVRQLVGRVSEAIGAGDVDLIARYALMKATSKEYVRESQVRLIVQPVLDRLVTQLENPQNVGERLLLLLHQLRQQPSSQGYAGGNIVNLLARLRGHLRGVDCSQLSLRQAHLQGMDAQDADLAWCYAGHALFTEPLETIASMTLSADGRFLAVGSFTGEIRVWRTSDGKPVWTGKSGERMVWGLAFNADAIILASGDYQGAVRLWRVADGHCLSSLEGHGDWVRTVAFHPGGSILASAGDDATIRLWDSTDGTCKHVLRGHAGLIWAVAFSPDGRQLASGSSDGTVRLWDVQDGAYLATLQSHPSGFYGLAFHPGGALCATGTEDGQISLLDVDSRRIVATPERQATGPATIAFNPEGTMLAGGSNEGVVEIWELSDGGELFPVRTLGSHPRLVRSVSFASHGLLASASYGGQVKLWDVETGRSLHTIQGYSTLITAVAFSPDGRLLAQGDDNGTLQVWETSTRHRLMAVRGHMGPIWTLAFSPDGKSVASGGDDVAVKLWQVRDGHLLKTLPGHVTVVWALAFSPDGALLVTGGADRIINLWHIGQAGDAPDLRTISGSPHWIWSLAFSPDGSQLASGHTNGRVELWSVADGRPVHSVQHNLMPVGMLRFSGDGRTLLTSNNQDILKRWDIESGACLGSSETANRGNWIKAVAIREDGRLLVTGSGDPTVRIWEYTPESDTHQARTLTGHAGGVWAVALSPSGDTIASSDDRGLTILWNAATGAELGRFSSDRPYERMNIWGITGLNEAQRAALRALGAVEDEERHLAKQRSDADRPALVLVDPEESAEARVSGHGR